MDDIQSRFNRFELGLLKLDEVRLPSRGDRLALLGGDRIRSLAETLEAFLDVDQRVQARLDRFVRNVAEHIRCNRVTQTVEVVDKLTAAPGQEQAVGATVPGVGPTLQQSVFDQAIEQTHKRNRLQLQHIGKIDLRKPLLLPKAKQHDPLRARRAAPLGAVVDVIAQQPRTLDELGDQPAFQIERHFRYMVRASALPNLSNCLGFSNYSVYTH